MLQHVRADSSLGELVQRLLANVWIVERIEDVDPDFDGIAVTVGGVAYRRGVGELRDLPQDDRHFAERARRRELEEELERATRELEQALAEAEAATVALRSAEESRDAIEADLRGARREREEALERARKAEWLAERRRDLGSGLRTRAAPSSLRKSPRNGASLPGLLRSGRSGLRDWNNYGAASSATKRYCRLPSGSSRRSRTRLPPANSAGRRSSASFPRTRRSGSRRRRSCGAWRRPSTAFRRACARQASC